MDVLDPIGFQRDLGFLNDDIFRIGTVSHDVRSAENLVAHLEPAHARPADGGDHAGNVPTENQREGVG